jgi:hypothetical protein
MDTCVICDKEADVKMRGVPYCSDHSLVHMVMGMSDSSEPEPQAVQLELPLG